MTPSGDYVHEMPTLHEIDDDTAEAILAGRSVPPELAGFMQTLRKSASRPVEPSAELAAHMATGRFPKARGAHRSSAHRPQGRGTGTAASAWLRTGVRAFVAVPRTLVAVPKALLAVPRTYATARRGVKLVVAAAVVAVPVVGLGGIGFAGALPEPVQERFEGVVESVTPYEFPTRGDGSSGFGERVSEDAKDGGVNGPEVSEEARDRGRESKSDDAKSGIPGPPDDLPTDPAGPPDDVPANPPGPPDDLPIDPPGPPDGLPVDPPGLSRLLPIDPPLDGIPSAPAHGRS